MAEAPVGSENALVPLPALVGETSEGERSSAQSVHCVVNMRTNMAVPVEALARTCHTAWLDREPHSRIAVENAWG